MTSLIGRTGSCLAISTSAVAVALLLPSAAAGQTVISARAGMVNYIEGHVLLKDEPVPSQPGHILHVEPGQYLRTEKGRAEVLFALGTYLRLGANAKIEMVSAGLTSASVRLHRGSMIVDAARIFDENSLVVLVRDAEIKILKKGLYRFDTPASEGASLHVMKGKAAVISGGVEHEVKKKRSIHFAGPDVAVSIASFDHRQEDELAAWSTKRATVVAHTVAADNKNNSGPTNLELIDLLPNRSRAGLNSP